MTSGWGATFHRAQIIMAQHKVARCLLGPLYRRGGVPIAYKPDFVDQ